MDNYEVGRKNQAISITFKSERFVATHPPFQWQWQTDRMPGW